MLKFVRLELDLVFHSIDPGLVRDCVWVIGSNLADGINDIEVYGGIFALFGFDDSCLESFH